MFKIFKSNKELNCGKLFESLSVFLSCRIHSHSPTITLNSHWYYQQNDIPLGSCPLLADSQLAVTGRGAQPRAPAPRLAVTLHHPPLATTPPPPLHHT
ncbi:unnamed protein product, partial [Brenthis ino]